MRLHPVKWAIIIWMEDYGGKRVCLLLTTMFFNCQQKRHALCHRLLSWHEWIDRIL